MKTYYKYNVKTNQYEQYSLLKETSRTYTFKFGNDPEVKVPKKDNLKTHGFLTKEEMEHDEFMTNNYHSLLNRFEQFVRSPEGLEKMKEVLSFKQGA